MNYRYRTTLQANNINSEALPGEIQKAIADLDSLAYDLEDLEEIGDDEQIRELTGQLKNLDSQISAAIAEWMDDEEEDTEEEIERQERLLDEWYASSRVVPAALLARSGIELPTTARWTRTIGGYRLEKKKFESVIHLSKPS